MERVSNVKVRFVAGLDLVGWDEERLVAWAVAAIGGLAVGLWLSQLLGLVR